MRQKGRSKPYSRKKKEKNRFWGEETAGFFAAGEKFLDVTRVNGSQK